MQALLSEGVVQAKEEARKKEETASKDREAALLRAQDDAKRRQEEAAHNDAVSAFQTLLAELVKDPYAQWKVDHTACTCQQCCLQGVAVPAHTLCALLQYVHACITHSFVSILYAKLINPCNYLVRAYLPGTLSI